MKKIELELMKDYRYLSKLEHFGGKLLFIETIADLEENGYKQRLHALDPVSGEDGLVLDFGKKLQLDVLKDTMFLREPVKDGLETELYTLDLDGNKTLTSTLPLSIGKVQDFDADCFLVQATTNMRCSDYYRLSDAERETYAASLKADEDYIILDEYPFFYNGAGFINGDRNNLFLMDKKDFSLKRIGPRTMDAESVITEGGKIYFLGNDFDSFKGIYSDVYCYDPETDTLTDLYVNDREYYFKQIFTLGGRLYVMASVEALIDGANVYTLEEGKLELVTPCEWMFYNSIGSDCRYGSTKNNAKCGDKAFFITVDNERSAVVSYDGKAFASVTDFEGSVDDLTFVGDRLFVIAMKDMKLQEVYEVGDDVRQLTCVNEEVLKDRYVAKPERFTAFNQDEIVGWALKPFGFDETKKYPCILDIHGGPKTAYGEVFYHEMQLWASEGYFVIFCNPHCSDGRGNAFADYVDHYGATDFFDIMKFVDKALELYPQIDPERVGVTGGSYGGYMTNWIITQTDRFKCAATQRSISNRHADFFYSDYAFDCTYENGIPLDDKALKLFWDRSPIKYWDKAKTPTLFIHSTLDFRCPFPEALQLYTALKINGVETRLCGFKGENHELSRSGKPTHRLRRLSEITGWMDKFLK